MLFPSERWERGRAAALCSWQWVSRAARCQQEPTAPPAAPPHSRAPLSCLGRVATLGISAHSKNPNRVVTQFCLAYCKWHHKWAALRLVEGQGVFGCYHAEVSINKLVSPSLILLGTQFAGRVLTEME